MSQSDARVNDNGTGSAGHGRGREIVVSEDEREWEPMAEWAEHRMRLPADSTTARCGADAARAGREALTRAESTTR